MVLADSFYYQPVQIDTINTRVNADLFAKEGDANGRGMVVQITENGIIKDTTGITLRLQWSHVSVVVSGFTDFEVVDATKGLYSYYTRLQCSIEVELKHSFVLPIMTYSQELATF